MVTDIETVKRIASDYAKDVGRLYPLEKTVLFGSHVKGTATPSSDIDICFFFKNYGGKGRYNLAVNLLLMRKKYKEYYIEPHLFETSDIDTDNPFVNNVLQTGIDLNISSRYDYTKNLFAN